MGTAVFSEVQNVVRDLSKERPVDDGVFRIYRRLFDYDPLDLDTKVEAVDDRPEHRDRADLPSQAI